MRCIASSLAPIQTNPRRTSFRTIYLIRFYAPFPQCQHDGGGGRLFSSLARLNFSRGDAFHSPTATRFVCAARGPSSVILFLRTMFAVRPFQSRVVSSPRKWRYRFCGRKPKQRRRQRRLHPRSCSWRKKLLPLMSSSLLKA